MSVACLLYKHGDLGSDFHHTFTKPEWHHTAALSVLGRQRRRIPEAGVASHSDLSLTSRFSERLCFKKYSVEGLKKLLNILPLASMCTYAHTHINTYTYYKHIYTHTHKHKLY